MKRGNLYKFWKSSLDTPKTSLERSFVRWMCLTLVLFLLYLLFMAPTTLFNLYQAHRTGRAQEKEILRLKGELDGMDRRLEHLSRKDSLEKYAREEFLFAEPGEDVYLVGNQ